MINSEVMLQGLEHITGIKLDRDENGMVNMTQFINDYRDKYPVQFKQRFGDANVDEVIAMFFSEKKLQAPDNTKTNQRTLDEILIEIQEIINNTHWVETRLAQLNEVGYQIENCWIKNGSIGVVWFMKRKKVFRIQVAESESYGDYFKANCVVIPSNNISIQTSDTTKIRNYEKFK